MAESERFKPPNYTAYLVRMWQESPHTPWRASAQCAGTGEKFYFATLDALFTFLHAQTVADQADVDENAPPKL
ncbi:MAG: hypothetical protein DYG89_08205 [Caldilinea sp. CFX5]|nr:hypothetical protein [Caldilinea sp. CFX5]